MPSSIAPAEGGKGRPEGAALGKYARCFDTAPKRANRLAAWSAKRTAANLLHRHDEKLATRISKCGYVAHAPAVELTRTARASGEVTGGLNGLVSCSSVWACPVCSARITAKRRDELNALLSWARAEGHAVVMLTLTARHNRRTALGPFLDGMKAAMARLRQSRTWRGLPHVGSVTVTEVTHGDNGWHPHGHWLLVLDAPADEACGLIETLRGPWLAALERQGLSGNHAAFQVQSGTAAGDYVQKWGAAEELALSGRKSARAKGSRTPWQLLADARDGDAQAARLWPEFAVAFKGKRQTHWSRGLKALAGIDDISDDEAAQAEPERLRSWDGKSDEWRAARRRRCALLDAAETGASLDAAEFGASDAARWRDERDAGEVLEGDGPAPVAPPAPPVKPAELVPRQRRQPLGRDGTTARKLTAARPSRSVEWGEPATTRLRLSSA